MKKIIYALLVLLPFMACTEDIMEDIKTGDIAGSVSDQTTGEPVATVNVVLNPGGKSTVTGSDGSFSYKDLEPGKYSLEINKEGYLNNSKEIIVAAGKVSDAHLLIERKPAKLTTDKDLLDFGNDKSLNTLSFSLVNPGYQDLAWEIEENCEWITEVKPTSGTLKYGKTETIVVIIDRNKLDGGDNKTVLVIRSTNGNIEIQITAIGEYTIYPSLEIFEAEEVKAFSAILKGEIKFPGTPEYTERGFVYSLAPMPTLEECEAKVSVPKDKENTYSYNITKLTLGATYYARAYAKNSKGVGYSSHDINFTTSAVAPEVVTKTITDINYDKGAATLHGEIIKEGEPPYSERGFVYGTSINPTINDNKVVKDGTGIGAYSSYVTGLPTDVTFYVRAYAKNEAGIVYGESVAKSPGTASASTLKVDYVSGEEGAVICYGSIIEEGEPPYTERGFVYGTSPNPTVNDNKIKNEGEGVGSFNSKIIGLETGKTLYFRAYVKNIAGVAYGEQITKTPEAPVVKTQKVEYVNGNKGSITMYATITNVGAPAYTERGFVYSTSPNPTINGDKVIKSGVETGVFSMTATNVDTEKVVYVRAYAISAIGTTYGEEISISPSKSQVSTQEITNLNLDKATATFHGTIINSGSPTYYERGFVFGTTSYPTINDNKIVKTGTGTGAFSCQASGIPTDTKFYVRAYAINEAGVVYGEQVTASPSLPVVTTAEFKYSETEDGTVTFYGTIVNAGAPAYTERGFVYSTSPNPTINGDKVISQGTGVGTFNATVSNLPTGQTLYARAYAINNAGVVYGEEVSRSPGMASVTTKEITNLNYTKGTATFHGNITSVGMPAYTERGFVYSTLPNPTTDNTKIVKEGSGTGSFSSEVTGLPSETLYVRAYATNAKGTAYGEQVTAEPTQGTVTTGSITSVDFAKGTATFSGTVTKTGNPEYTERGFAYGTTPEPTINDNKVISEGNGASSFTCNVTGISAEKLYVRAFVTNVTGTVYGEVVSVSPSAPTVSTGNISNVDFTQGTATFTGSITNTGNPHYSERGFVYGTMSYPTIYDNKIVCSGTGVGTFTSTATGLPSEKIYMRAYATNSTGTVYGSNVYVETTAPSVAPATISNIDFANGTAQITSSITNAGNPHYIEKGFVYCTSVTGIGMSPTTNDKKIICTGTDTGVFSCKITELPANSRIHVRAYVINSLGTYYSEYTEWEDPTNPIISTMSVTNIDYENGTATFIGSIINSGNPRFFEKGFVYGSSPNPTISDNKIVNTELGIGEYKCNAIGLPISTENIYIRAYATSLNGTTYGDDIIVGPEYIELTSANLMVQTKDLGNTSSYTAITLCQSSSLGGYNDWRLPSKEELIIIHSNKNKIGNFKEKKYWSSTLYENDSRRRYYVDFKSGEISVENAYNDYYVRAVRTIK